MAFRSFIAAAIVLAGCAGPAVPLRPGGPADPSAVIAWAARPPPAFALPPSATLSPPAKASAHEGHDGGASGSKPAAKPAVKPDPHAGHRAPGAKP